MVELLETEHVKVALACRTLEVSRSGYYDWIKRPESYRVIETSALLMRIRAVHDFSKQTYAVSKQECQNKPKICTGHAALIVGYDLSQKLFFIKNSWG